MQNADCILIMGSNMAEPHPVGFRYGMKARERGAKVIPIDPRYGRTGASASLHVPIRPGTDIAFLGGLIRHVIETESYFRDYVLHYTNAATLISEEFRDTEDLDGVFSGFDSETGTYDRASWIYEGGEMASASGTREHATQAFDEQTGAGLMEGAVKRDPTLEHPRCVLQVVRRHYSRYTPEMVERVCGVPRESFLEVAEALIANSGRERTALLAYAVGWRRRGGAGGGAPADNDCGLAARPRISGTHAHSPTMLRALDGGLDGLFCRGQTPAVGSQNSGLMRRALAHLKWLVVRDLAEVETATFWRDSPEVLSGELRTEDIETEVFLMPAASHVEKEGSFTNTQRLVQWRDKALEPPGDARSELWFMHHLTKRVQAHYAESDDPRDWGIRHLRWWEEEPS